MACLKRTQDKRLTTFFAPLQEINQERNHFRPFRFGEFAAMDPMERIVIVFVIVVFIRPFCLPVMAGSGRPRHSNRLTSRAPSASTLRSCSTNYQSVIECSLAGLQARLSALASFLLFFWLSWFACLIFLIVANFTRLQRYSPDPLKQGSDKFGSVPGPSIWHCSLIFKF